MNQNRQELPVDPANSALQVIIEWFRAQGWEVKDRVLLHGGRNPVDLISLANVMAMRGVLKDDEDAA